MMHEDNPVLKAIYGRRSVREYTDQPVSREMVLEIIKAGTWSPSGLNNQPWRFAIVRDKKIKAQIADQTKYGIIIEQAPVIIVVFIDKNAMYDQVKDHQTMGACIQNMLLVTHAIGLGGVWLGEILKNADGVRQILELPQNLELMAVVALGYPTHRNQRSTRKSVESIILKEI